MAESVTAQALGGVSKTVEANTVQELVNLLDLGDNHTVKINGEVANYDDTLEDYDFVSFGEKVKGGQ